ncbi:hypothetical protein M413DRAFT_422275 [Hebeloma cylindrosporum]|uniref:BTB domain-containing protein n=1 Tax=Hebeloma cylindrosporum TaxID=76867 RepID=A0A0C2Z0Z1_HEBCY|nr:hypothetical protein M413DRAFT_422275 [Hebeloma cylindrosporum h7]
MLLHMFKKIIGGDSDGNASSTSSEPTPLPPLNSNRQSEVVQTTSGDNYYNPREAPTTQSNFFSDATGTTVSGARFSSTNVTVHVHPNPMNTGEQPNPVVQTLASATSPPPLPVSTVNVTSSSYPANNMGALYLTESSAIDVDPPKVNEMYERLLRKKGRGFALYIPQPNRRLPIAYQRLGIHIGDVGFITPDGGFSFLFNICVPRDHAINPRDLPQDFSPLSPALATQVDVAEFSQFNPGSYLASASMERKENDSNTNGLHFETHASEGAVLTMPEGATSLDLNNELSFSDYLEANVRKWYEFVRRVRGKRIRNGELRLVIGCDKTTAWGIATVSGMSQQRTSKLKFKPLDIASSSSTTTYTWESSGMVEEKVGPDSRDIEVLRSNDDDGPDMTYHNQCLFVRTMTATLGNDDWAEFEGNLGKTTVEDSRFSSPTDLNPLPGMWPSGSSNTKYSNQFGSHQGTYGTQSYSLSKKGRVTISTMPDSSTPYHPSDVLNQQLLQKFPDCKMVITKDHAWLSTFREDEEMVSDPEQLLEKVLASHDVRVENGVLRLYWEKETPRFTPSELSLSSHVLARMSTEYNSPPLAHHEQYYISGGDLFIVVEKTLFRVHSYFFLRESNDFAELITPASREAKRRGSDVSTAITLDELSPEDFAKFLWVFYNPLYDLYDASVEDWEVILALSNRWTFPEVKNLATRELERKPMRDVKRIKLYHEHNLDRNCLIPCYIALCEREDPLTVEEGIDLGMATVTQIVAAREYVRRLY